MTTIGDSAAPSTHTIYYDSLLSTTLMAYRKTMVDNIFKDSAFLAYMRMTDSIKKQNGGERIAMPLMYGDNQTVKTVGGYEILDTTPQEGFTTASNEHLEMGFGAGMGLPNIKKNVDSLEIQSEKGKGTHLKMRFQVKKDSD